MCQIRFLMFPLFWGAATGLDQGLVERKVEFENNQVRIMRAKIGPHVKSPMHKHPPTVHIFLTDFRSKFTSPDGKTEEIHRKAGGVVSSPALKHATENLSDASAEIIEVELMGNPSQGGSAKTVEDLFVTVGKSVIVDIPMPVQRISVADANLAEAVVVTPREVVVSGKAPGETTLIIWQQRGARQMFDLHVRRSTAKLDAVRRIIQEELTRKDP